MSVPATVPRSVAFEARRRLLLEIRRVGLAKSDIDEWSTGCWWPSIRTDPAIERVKYYLKQTFGLMQAAFADTQILLRFPDEDDEVLGQPHQDVEPQWVTDLGMRFSAVYGVELNDSNSGVTVVYPNGPDGHQQPVFLQAGDCLAFHPKTYHSGSPNLGHDIRMALFFRTLEPI